MKDTCKQAFFRRKNPGQQRSIEDALRAGDQEERELEFFNILYVVLYMLCNDWQYIISIDERVPVLFYS